MSRPLRLALVVGTLGLGGTETQVVGLARKLKSLGVDVEVLLLMRKGPLAELLDEAGVQMFCAEYPGLRFRDRAQAGKRPRVNPLLPILDAGRLIRMAWHIKRRRFDVMHAFLFHSYAIVLPLARLCGVPVRVAGRRGLHNALRSSLVVGPLTSLSVHVSTAVVANSEAVADDARRNERVPASKLHLIRNGVDLPELAAHPGRIPPVGLMIANLIHYKGHLDLIQALALMTTPPRIRCIGEGPMRLPIELALREANLSETVTLEGRRDRARDLYLEVQFALLTSRTEGMPNAILEAMAAGLPVVATDVGGCRELVEDGVTGLLVPPGDPVALANALQRLLEDHEFRVRAGMAGRQRAAAFGWPEVVRAHLELYMSLLHASR